MAHFRHFTK